SERLPDGIWRPRCAGSGRSLVLFDLLRVFFFQFHSGVFQCVRQSVDLVDGVIVRLAGEMLQEEINLVFIESAGFGVIVEVSHQPCAPSPWKASHTFWSARCHMCSESSKAAAR